MEKSDLELFCLYMEKLYLTLTLETRSYEALLTQYPLHYVTYAPAKFEVVSFNGLKDAFTRNT